MQPKSQNHRNDQKPGVNPGIMDEVNKKRDQLRLVGKNHPGYSANRNKVGIVLAMLALVPIFLILGIFMPLANDSGSNQISLESIKNARQEPVAFALPSNLATLSSEEQAALSVLLLARQNRPKQITTIWTDQDNLSLNDVTAEFAELIKAYSEDANGAEYNLIAKQNGKKIFNEGAEKLVSSIVYESSFLGFDDSIFVKLNFYENGPEEADGNEGWRLYYFEFSSDVGKDGKVPLEASF